VVVAADKPLASKCLPNYEQQQAVPVHTRWALLCAFRHNASTPNQNSPRSVARQFFRFAQGIVAGGGAQRPISSRLGEIELARSTAISRIDGGAA